MFIYKIANKQKDNIGCLDDCDYLYRSDYDREELKRLGLTLVGIRVDNTNVYFDGRLYHRWLEQRADKGDDMDKKLGLTPSDKGNIVHMDKHKLKEK